jgi:hypothetical protein
LLLAASSQAAIVYTAANHVLTQGGARTYFDLETGAITTTPGMTTNWDFSIDPAAGGGMIDGVTSVDPDTFIVASLDGFARQLKKGDSVKGQPTGLFDSFIELDNFIGETGFLGMNFADQFGFQHYVWVRIKQEGTIPNGGDITVIDWAYEPGLEEDILAGAGIPVPEPSTGALVVLAAGAIAAAARRR